MSREIIESVTYSKHSKLAHERNERNERRRVLQCKSQCKNGEGASFVEQQDTVVMAKKYLEAHPEACKVGLSRGEDTCSELVRVSGGFQPHENP